MTPCPGWRGRVGKGDILWEYLAHRLKKNNSTFWLVWTLGTSASVDLLDSLNRGMKAPGRGGNTKGGCSEAVESLLLREIQQWTGQSPKQPDVTLKVAYSK